MNVAATPRPSDWSPASVVSELVPLLSVQARVTPIGSSYWSFIG